MVTHFGKCGRVIMLRMGYQVVGQLAQDAGHHGQVLQVVVGLEQGVALQMVAGLRREVHTPTSQKYTRDIFSYCNLWQADWCST